MLKTNVALGLTVVAGLCVACVGSNLKPDGSGGSGGSTVAAAGQDGAAGDAAAAGQTGAAGGGGAAGQTGTAGDARDASAADGTTSDAAASPDGGDHPEGGADGPRGTDAVTSMLPDDNDLRKVVKTLGCGLTPPDTLVPGTLVQQMITTAGTKSANCADTKCGAWTDEREYWVRLPTGYDKTKAYPLVIEGPGCGGHGNNLYSIQAFNSTVIRVGLTPSAVWQAFHATNRGQGCFDTHDGNDSVDFVFYERLYDKLAAQLCFDRNRVFVAGQSTGAWLANDLGCKYAGDSTRPIRGVMVHSGGLPADPKFMPTCSKKPMTGIWLHRTGDMSNPFSGSIFAMDRALTVDACTPAGVTYQTAMFQPFPISATDNFTCKRYQGCSELTPLVVCPLAGDGGSSGDTFVAAGWPTFVNLFNAAPLLTP